MSIAARKRCTVGVLGLLICLANVNVFVNWLVEIGLISWARTVCDQYLTGTAVTVIVCLLVLLPSGTVIAVCIQRCRVCEALLLRRGKYCSECGSRI